MECGHSDDFPLVVTKFREIIIDRYFIAVPLLGCHLKENEKISYVSYASNMIDTRSLSITCAGFLTQWTFVRLFYFFN